MLGGFSRRRQKNTTEMQQLQATQQRQRGKKGAATTRLQGLRSDSDASLRWRFSGRYVAGAVTFPVRRINVDHEAPRRSKGPKAAAA